MPRAQSRPQRSHTGRRVSAQSANPHDLEKYREFCVDHGFVFDEKTLYDMRVFSYRQYQKDQAGKQAKNNWDALVAHSRL